MSPLVTVTLMILLLLLMIWTAIEFQHPTLLRAGKTMTDFDAFYVAGLMYWEGRLNEAYHFARLYEAQRRFTGVNSFMPWTYPPPFNLVTAALASLPVGLAYLAFIGTSFAAYAVVVRRIAGIHAATVLVTMFPTVAVNIRSGQNGLLTGTLVGLFLLSYLRGQAGGGVALGCMVFKPHLAVGSAVLALVEWRWRRIVACAVTVFALVGLSAAVFGLQVFSAFLAATGEAGRFLALGLYPLFRMTSLYAALFTAGASPGLALLVQAISALIACVSIVVAAIRCEDRRYVAALAAFGSMLVSPYNYDYDLAVLGIAAAILWPLLMTRARPTHLFGLIALYWLAAGWGLLMSIWTTPGSGQTAVLPDTASLPSISGLALIALLVATTAILRRPPLVHDPDASAGPDRMASPAPGDGGKPLQPVV
jgi:hypothetical protein